MTELIVFLLDVDNTLLDNDTAQGDFIAEIQRTVSAKAAQRYWKTFQDIVNELGYADYLGALQRYRMEDMHDPKLLHMSSYLLDYDFVARLCPRALEMIEYLRAHGTVVILTDGDVVFQPRKIVRSGLWDAVGGKVLICIHKEQELRQVERRFPARHYVMVDDKLRLLAAIKRHWRERVTTVFVRQGHYAADPAVLADYPPADITLMQIDELLHFQLDDFLQAAISQMHKL
jgi:FMN phosphatase YigB (HAD superfamily)